MTQTNRKIQYLAGLCASSNFMFTGAVISWSSPAIPKLLSGEANVQITEAQISWIASLFAIGAIMGCFIGHPLLDRVGRRKALCCGTLPGIIGAGIILLTKSAEWMYFSRIMSGISLGMTAVVVMIYITEIADKEIRGSLGMSVQVTNNLGCLVVYCVGPFVSYNVLNVLVLTIPVANLLSCLWIPESPYYHMKDGRIAAARMEFMKIKGTDDEKLVDEQLGIIRAHVRESMENKTTLWELVSNMKYRKALYIVAGLKMLQYMTGGMAIQAYLEVIFRQSSSISGPLVSIVYGFVQLVTGVGGALLAGYFGRRILMFVSNLGVSLSLTALGLYFYLQDTVKLSYDYILPLDLITKEVFTKWMEVLRAVMEQPVPEHTLQVDEDERLELPWWKCKKWAVHTLYRLFERYGSPVNTRKEYVQFAEWYLTTFTGGILEVLLRVLDQYRNKIYVSPRVLQQTISYIDQCVSHSHSWKLLKPHMFAIIQDVLFPLMSYSEADEELWNTDPHEYIRIKFDIFEDFVSPIIAAQTLLISCCKKRKEMLERTMQLCMQVLTSQNGEYSPRQRDGALHMVGTLSDLLIKKKFYKEEIDSLLSQYVFPEYSSPLGYMRARACWVLHCFATVRFKSEPLLIEAVRLTVNALLNDTDLPVKVEAAIALQTLLSSQEKVQKLLEPQVKAVTTELLKVIRETENDNIASVLQKIVPLYTEQLMPMAYEITEHLATTFRKVIETDSGTDEKAITAMGLLNTMETVLNVMEDNPEIMAQLEKTVLTVVGHILQNNIIEYYEEAMTLLCNLTDKMISEDMWKVLELLYQVFEKDSFDYFTDMMPVLHNYITVDTNAFVSIENHILAMFNMAKAVLNSDSEDESEIYAAKLLEVMVLQCNGKIDNCLPSFVELVLNRLTRTVKTSELRTMLLQVLIAILYCNPVLLFTILDKLQESVPNASITQHFIKQWIHDTDCFMGLHDRKLCVLGICTLLEMGPARPNLEAVLPKVLPSCLVLFDGLKRAYEARAEADEDTSSEEEDDDQDEEVLSSDEDDIEDMNNEYLENLARMAVKNSAQQGVNMTAKIEDYEESDDDDEDYEPDETAIECYTTPLDDRDCVVDEYVKFKSALSGISTTEPALYHALTSVLDEEQQKQLSAVLVLADQRKAQQDSKRIEQSGGYSFTVPAQVPTKFKFGS